LGLDAGISFGKLSAARTNYNAGHNETVAKLREIGGSGVKCQYKTRGKKGKPGRELGIDEGGWYFPKAKAAKCKAYYNVHKEELDRIYRTNWRYNKIKNLLLEAEAHPDKAESCYQQIQELLQDQENDK
jgi:hypothetical protein